MKLNKIKISGIFNLKDVEISLDDLSALIAPNNYGKSNVLRAIDFGVFFMEASLKRKLSLMRNRSLIPINTALEGTPFSFELENFLMERKHSALFTAILLSGGRPQKMMAPEL